MGRPACLALSLLAVALGSLATYLIWVFPGPGGEAVRQLKVIGIAVVWLVVLAYFLTCFILLAVGVEQAREA
jgi:hypothetical protein